MQAWVTHRTLAMDSARLTLLRPVPILLLLPLVATQSRDSSMLLALISHQSHPPKLL